jgi:hypothetical protein
LTEEAVAIFAPDKRPDLVVEVEVLLAVMEVPRFLAAAASYLSFSALLPIVVGGRYKERRNMSTTFRWQNPAHIFNGQKCMGTGR